MPELSQPQTLTKNATKYCTLCPCAEGEASPRPSPEGKGARAAPSPSFRWGWGEGFRLDKVLSLQVGTGGKEMLYLCIVKRLMQNHKTQ